jgi:magnesium chelatase family protein
VPAVKYEKLSDDRLGEPSAVVRAWVEAAREIQRRRFEGTTMACNADSAQSPCGMGPAEIREFRKVDEASKNLLKAATVAPERAGLSPRDQAGPQICGPGLQ